MRSPAPAFFLLFLCFALSAALPTALARSGIARRVQRLSDRVQALYRAGKYSEAIPLAEQYAADAKARYGETT